MKAVVYTGTRKVKVQDVPDARIEHPTDVLMRVTSSALCGSDLHMYDGRIGAEPGLQLGHEPLGVIEEVGPGVQTLRRGDRVVVPTHIFCGLCYMCAQGYSAACLRVRDGGVGAAYGYAGMGPYPGGQAELLRVPYADANCVPLPGEAGDEREDDFVLLADALVTGWHACELARVGPTDSVAIFGAGAIGLLAAMSALARGASEVYVVDYIAARLGKAAEIGAIPIDFRRGDPVEQILAERERRLAGGLPPGEEKLAGVTCAIDAVGFQARNRGTPDEELPNQVIGDLARIVNPAGRLGIAGVYSQKDLAPRPESDEHGSERVPWGTLFGKGVTVGFGRTHDRRYTAHLRDQILAGRIRPGVIVTHHPSLDEAPHVYDAFDRRAEGIIKAVFRPA